MSVSSTLFVLIVGLTGLLALLACVAVLLWLLGQFSGQPVTFRQTFVASGRLLLGLLALGGALLGTLWLVQSFLAR